MRRKVAIPVVLVLLVVGAGWWLWQSNPAVRNMVLSQLDITPATNVQGITASGFIEAEEIEISSETGGRVKAVHVREGDEVTAGQVLVELDTDLLEAQRKQAEAALTKARAQLDRVQAGARPEQIRQAEVAVEQAKVARDNARQALEDTIAARDNPQALELQIDAARAQYEAAKHQVEQAEATVRALEEQYNLMGRTVEDLRGGIDVSFPLPTGGVFKKHIKTNRVVTELSQQWNELGQNLWQANTALALAQANRDAARQKLADLLRQRENPQAANVQVAAAEARLAAAEQGIKVAEAKLALVRAGATEEQVAMAQAGVEQAQAALNTLEVQLSKKTLKSPRDGWVVERLIHEGELAAPGATLLTLADLREVTLTVYVAEDEIGRVMIGQPVAVTVDSYPGRTFKGQVSYISSQAEFTPKNVQTKEERVNTVFAVKVRLSNPDHALKPGMPADAVILESGG
jgi:multidrug efflux pump subunit AcrA (membrane-fusion protein)